MKIDAICENRDYKKIYSRGKSIVTPCVVIYISKSRINQTRLGITTSKKVGNAVLRNRARRVLREAMREIIESLPKNYDIILVARGKTPHCKSNYVKKVLVNQFKSAGLM